jgi:hypothetical protein
MVGAVSGRMASVGQHNGDGASDDLHSYMWHKTAEEIFDRLAHIVSECPNRENRAIIRIYSPGMQLTVSEPRLFGYSSQDQSIWRRHSSELQR